MMEKTGRGGWWEAVEEGSQTSEMGRGLGVGEEGKLQGPVTTPSERAKTFGMRL